MDLIGVWNWRGSNEADGVCALPDWESIALKDRQGKGRTTLICFDSDVILKESVYASMVRLSRFLKGRGADVSFIYLPCGPDGRKVGLDAYLVAGHTMDDLFQLATRELRKPPGKEGDGEADGPSLPYRSTPNGLVWAGTDSPGRSTFSTSGAASRRAGASLRTADTSTDRTSITSSGSRGDCESGTSRRARRRESAGYAPRSGSGGARSESGGIGRSGCTGRCANHCGRTGRHGRQQRGRDDDTRRSRRNSGRQPTGSRGTGGSDHDRSGVDDPRRAVGDALASSYHWYQRAYQESQGDRDLDSIAERVRAVWESSPKHLRWDEVGGVADYDPAQGVALFEKVKDYARAEVATGLLAAHALDTFHSRPIERARFLAVREALADGWNPQNGTEWLLIDQMAQAYYQQLHWTTVLVTRTQEGMGVDLKEIEENNRAKRDKWREGTWRPVRQSEAEAVETAAQMMDRFNRLFLRTLRQLRELRRFAPPVVVNNGGQVNIGEKQINVAPGNATAEVSTPARGARNGNLLEAQ